MPKALILSDTFLKKQLLGADELSDAEKVFMPKGKDFLVSGYYPDRNQHLRLTLASPVAAKNGSAKLQTVFAYDPHIQIEGEETRRVTKLNVRYFSQLGNEEIVRQGVRWFDWRQCNTTSNAMLADFLLQGELTKRAAEQGLREPESAYMRVVAKFGDTTDHNAQTSALKVLGIESYFSQSLSGKDVIALLQAGIPVVVGFAYKSSGHICVIVGYDPVKKNWLVHDPYGTRHGASNSYDIGVGGAFDEYSNDIMQQIFWDQGGEAGWGRVVTSVKGKSTGLTVGL